MNQEPLQLDETPSAPALHDLFAEHGLRCTRQRCALYQALTSTQSHPTADDLFRKVTTQRPDMSLSLATVYNTLEALCDAGLVQKLAGQDGSARYDATCADHLHLRCQKTGKLADVPEELSRQFIKRLPADMLRRIEADTGFKVDHVRIELHGQFE
ncbi:MAG: transcriptional repressor [Phycisphaeraceae bacterium]